MAIYDMHLLHDIAFILDDTRQPVAHNKFQFDHHHVPSFAGPAELRRWGIMKPTLAQRLVLNTPGQGSKNKAHQSIARWSA